MPHPDIIFQPLNYLQINPGTKLPPLKDRSMNIKISDYSNKEKRENVTFEMRKEFMDKEILIL